MVNATVIVVIVSPSLSSALASGAIFTAPLPSVNDTELPVPGIPPFKSTTGAEFVEVPVALKDTLYILSFASVLLILKLPDIPPTVVVCTVTSIVHCIPELNV